MTGAAKSKEKVLKSFTYGEYERFKKSLFSKLKFRITQKYEFFQQNGQLK